MEIVDPFAFITIECLIPASQHQLLSTTSFYRQLDLSPAADDCGFDDTWPVSSDDDNGDGDGDGVPLPEDNNDEITFCSVPSTPDNQDDVVSSLSNEFEVNAVIKLNDVVSGCSEELEGNAAVMLDAVVSPNPDELEESSPVSAKAPRSFDLNDVVSGISNELEGLCVQSEEKSDLNDVVCGSSDELGFVSERKGLREESFVTPSPSETIPTYCDVNDVVCGESDLLGFSVETKRAREEDSVTPPTKAKKKLRFSDNTQGIQNDVVSEKTEGILGLRSCENNEGIQNDVVSESSGDLGLRFCDEGDKIALENTEEIVNDVVGEDSDELGLCTEEIEGKENSLTQLMEDTKEVKNDIVSENSIDLGFNQDRNTTNEEFVSPATAEFIENTKNVQNDIVSEKSVVLGERNVTNAEFTMPSPSTTKELRSPELDGAEMEVETENTVQIDGDTEEVTVVDDCKGKEHDTERVIEDDVISDNTEEIDTSEDESGDDNGDGDTQKVAYEDKLTNSTLDRDSEAEICGNHVKCLMDVMKTLAERSRKKEKEGGGGEVDFLETAKRRGYTFPKPRWMSS